MISLTSMANPDLAIQGEILSIEGRYAELSVYGQTTLRQGSLLKFETPDTLYLGEIESSWQESDGCRFRILIEHSVDLARADAIRRQWNSDNPLSS